MRKALSSTCIFAVCIFAASVPSAAQDVIHALTGTVSAIDGASKTITVFQDNGSTGVFTQMSDPKTRISFDKKVAGAVTAAEKFDKSGAYAIVFFFGNSQNPTVVALKSLGAGPFESTVGTVTKVESHNRSISVIDDTGAAHTFKIDQETVAEGAYGVVDGEKLAVNKGAHVRIVSSKAGGDPTALFVRAM